MYTYFWISRVFHKTRIFQSFRDFLAYQERERVNSVTVTVSMKDRYEYKHFRGALASMCEQ
jgi:hypothetical protein